MLELYESIEAYYDLIRKINFYIHRKNSLVCMRHTNAILITLVNKGIISLDDFEDGLKISKKAFQDEIENAEQEIEKLKIKKLEIENAFSETDAGIDEGLEKDEMAELFDYLFGGLKHEK